MTSSERVLQGAASAALPCVLHAQGNSGRTQHDAARLAWTVTTRVKARRLVDTTEEEGVAVLENGDLVDRMAK